MFECLVIVAILTVALLAGAAMISSSHPNDRTRAFSQLAGIIERAHALAYTNGATLQIAPAGKGSRLTLLDGFGSGNVVETLSTDVAVALHYSGGAITTAQLAIRRDGSWYPLVRNVEQLCTGSEALGLIENNNGQLGESHALSCSDLHIPVAQ